jgi:hypothetical protein
VSCYTLLSRFRLPWPLPSCYYGATPFVGLLRHRGRPRLFCHSCLPGWPTSPPHARPSAFDDTPPRGPLVSSAATAFRCLFGGPLSWEKFRREPATSALVWSFAPLRSSHKRLAAQHCSGPPALFPAPSSWPRKDRALSGRPGRAPPSSCLSVAPLLGTRYRSACALARCRLARPWHSSVRVSRRAVPLPPLFNWVGGHSSRPVSCCPPHEGPLPLTLLCAIGLAGLRFLESARTSPSRCTPKHRYSPFVLCCCLSEVVVSGEDTRHTGTRPLPRSILPLSSSFHLDTYLTSHSSPSLSFQGGIRAGTPPLRSPLLGRSPLLSPPSPTNTLKSGESAIPLFFLSSYGWGLVRPAALPLSPPSPLYKYKDKKKTGSHPRCPGLPRPPSPELP